MQPAVNYTIEDTNMTNYSEFTVKVLCHSTTTIVCCLSKNNCSYPIRMVSINMVYYTSSDFSTSSELPLDATASIYLNCTYSPSQKYISLTRHPIPERSPLLHDIHQLWLQTKHTILIYIASRDFFNTYQRFDGLGMQLGISDIFYYCWYQYFPRDQILSIHLKERFLLVRLSASLLGT